MARPPKPWYDATHQKWRVYFNKKRHTLASGPGPKAEREAWEAFARLQDGGRDRERYAPPMNPKTVPLVRELVDQFMEVGCRGLREGTIAAYRDNLSRFKADLGRMSCADIAPCHVTEWMSRVDSWGQARQRNVVVAIKRCFSWALNDGRLPTNPIVKLKLPALPQRITIPNRDEIAALVKEAAKTDVGAILAFMQHTGCRAGEAMALKASDLSDDLSTASVQNKTGRATGKQRIIYVPVAIRDMVRSHVNANPMGPIFRTSRGLPWTKATVSKRVRAIRDKLGLSENAVPKMMRHDWITEALARGVPVKIVAELAGHTSTKMIDDNYSHLGDRTDVLARAAESVRADAKNKADE